MCVVCVHVCLCVQEKARGGHLLRQSLSMNLELGQGPQDPSNPPVSTLQSAGIVRVCTQPHLAFSMGAVDSNTGP